MSKAKRKQIVDGKPSGNLKSNIETVKSDGTIVIKDGAERVNKPKEIQEIEHVTIGYGYSSAEALDNAIDTLLDNIPLLSLEKMKKISSSGEIKKLENAYKLLGNAIKDIKAVKS